MQLFLGNIQQVDLTLRDTAHNSLMSNLICTRAVINLV